MRSLGIRTLTIWAWAITVRTVAIRTITVRAVAIVVAVKGGGLTTRKVSTGVLFQMRLYIKINFETNHKYQYRCGVTQCQRQTTSENYYQVHKDNPAVRFGHLLVQCLALIFMATQKVFKK